MFCNLDKCRRNWKCRNWEIPSSGTFHEILSKFCTKFPRIYLKNRIAFLKIFLQSSVSVKIKKTLLSTCSDIVASTYLPITHDGNKIVKNETPFFRNFYEEVLGNFVRNFTKTLWNVFGLELLKTLFLLQLTFFLEKNSFR